MATPALQPVSTPVRFRNTEVFVISLLCLVLPTASAMYMSPRWGWFVVALSMVVYLLFLGRWISGRPLGVLVNERNLMSLSRFQMVSWTVLLLSAFFTVALKRLHVLSPNHAALPLNIAMDWRLFALMGISATSLVGTPLLLSSKTSQGAGIRDDQQSGKGSERTRRRHTRKQPGTTLLKRPCQRRIVHGYVSGRRRGKHGVCGCLESSNVLLHRRCDHCLRVCPVRGDGKRLSPGGVYNANPFGCSGCVTGNQPRSVLDKQDNAAQLKWRTACGLDSRVKRIHGRLFRNSDLFPLR